jgi:hypothetical protein
MSFAAGQGGDCPADGCRATFAPDHLDAAIRISGRLVAPVILSEALRRSPIPRRRLAPTEESGCL